MTAGPWRSNPGGRARERSRKARAFYGAERLQRRALETDADRARLAARVRVVEWTVAAAVLILLLGFWQLQLVHGAHYAELADNNQLRQTRIRAARGLILDRNGEVLATNRASYEVALIREAVEDETAVMEWLSTVLDQPLATLRARIDTQRRLPRFMPAVLASGVSQDKVVTIQARRREYPGVIVQVGIQRYYPRGTMAAHVLGHVGEISPRQLATWGSAYSMGDIVGQLGVEGVYNDDLAGAPGSKLAVVDSSGREVRTLEQQPPDPGRTVILTLDVNLQERIEALLRGRKGAVVVLDANTGGILALASSPSFDPNAFAARFSVQDWQALIQDPERPLRNRTLGANLPPGSIFKLVVATAGLEEGIITPRTRYFCPGGKTFYGRFFDCLGQHGEVNVVQALALSCNSFFYELGVRLGRERIVKWASRLGLGNVTGIDLPQEQSGLIPSDEWLQSTGRRYYPGDTVSISIGQGMLQVSPLQLAHLVSIVATGFVRQPHLLYRVEEPSAGRAAARTHTLLARPAEFRESTRRVVLRGMAGSISYGTSRQARLQPIQVGGKTGTAQLASSERVAEKDEDRPEHLRNHAWFVAVAPIQEPEIVLAVFLEHAGGGGAVAAPLGGQVLASYFGVPADQVGYREIPIDPRETTQRGQREPTLPAARPPGSGSPRQR